MNLYFKTVLFTGLFSLQLFSRDIIVITTSPQNVSKIELIKNIITKKIGIPNQLITTKIKENPCDPINNSIVHVCYSNNDIIFPVFKQETVQESFKIFRQEVKK